jgi:hypothetical protein
MIARHEQITAMAEHYGLLVNITRRNDGHGSAYAFHRVVLRKHRTADVIVIGRANTPKEAIAWLAGFQAAKKST